MAVQELRSEFGELKQLYDESVKNTNALEAEIAGLKGEHESEKVGGRMQCGSRIKISVGYVSATSVISRDLGPTPPSFA